jgi:tetratricopeptide (TPR) repeat protein
MRNRWALIFMLMHIASFSGAATAQTLEQQRCFAPGPGDDRIGSCTAMIQSDQETPGNLAEAFYNRGVAYTNEGQPDRAIEDLDQAIRLNPNDAMAFNSRGNAHFSKGGNMARENGMCLGAYRPASCASAIAQYDRAIEDYDQAIRLNPNNALAFFSRGRAYANKGQLDRAIEDYDRAIRLNPNDALALVGRGSAYVGKGQYDRAIEDLDQAIRLNPNYADAFFNRGNLYLSADKGPSDRAIEDYDQAIRLNPNYAEAFFVRGAAYFAKGQSDRAIEDFDQAIRLIPNDTKSALAYGARSLAKSAKGDFAGAAADLAKAQQLSSSVAK